MGEGLVGERVLELQAFVALFNLLLRHFFEFRSLEQVEVGWNLELAFEAAEINILHEGLSVVDNNGLIHVFGQVLCVPSPTTDELLL